MPQIIFAFTMKTETKEATFSGNVAPATALQVLQEIVVADAIASAKAKEAEAEPVKPVKGLGDRKVKK